MEVAVAGTPVFDSAINSGTVKWAVLSDGRLVVVPKLMGKYEVPHSILSGGGPVRAAGEADLAGTARTGYFAIEIDNHSGHFLPTIDSVAIGIAAFRSAGVTFLGE